MCKNVLFIWNEVVESLVESSLCLPFLKFTKKMCTTHAICVNYNFSILINTILWNMLLVYILMITNKDDNLLKYFWTFMCPLVLVYSCILSFLNFDYWLFFCMIFVYTLDSKFLIFFHFCYKCLLPVLRSICCLFSLWFNSFSVLKHAYHEQKFWMFYCKICPFKIAPYVHICEIIP